MLSWGCSWTSWLCYLPLALSFALSFPSFNKLDCVWLYLPEDWGNRGGLQLSKGKLNIIINSHSCLSTLCSPFPHPAGHPSSMVPWLPYNRLHDNFCLSGHLCWASHSHLHANFMFSLLWSCTKGIKMKVFKRSQLLVAFVAVTHTVAKRLAKRRQRDFVKIRTKGFHRHLISVLCCIFR